MKWIILIILLIPLTSANCEDIYFFILDNNYEYNQTDLIENNITQQQIDNYTLSCELKGYYKLPEKPKIEDILINLSKCELKVNKYFKNSVPFADIHIDSKCSTAKILNYFFVLENSNSYIIKRIRIWWIVLTFFFLFVTYLFKENSFLNHQIDKFKSRENLDLK